MSVSTEQLIQSAYVTSKKTVSFSDMHLSDDERMAFQIHQKETFDHGEEEDDDKEEYHGRHSGNSRSGNLWQSLLCLTCGIVFGISLDKTHVSYPDAIRKQMLLKQFTLVKFFLSALATSMFTLSILAMIPLSHRSFMITCNKYYNKLADKSVLSSVVGGLVMGAGMTLAGSCPVSIFPQIGSCVPNVGYTFLGSLAGVLVYSVVKPAFDSLFRPTIKESSNPWANSPYFVLALPLVAMFGITVCAFETLLPWDTELQVGKNRLQQLEAWPPYVGGMLVGVLQLPLVLSLHETLGGSSSLIVMVSQVLVGPLKKLSPFACQYQSGFKHWWQIFYVVGAIAGGFLSARASGTLGSAVGVPCVDAFLGGILMNVGARIGGGCTSGHGFSGMGLLSILSFIMMTSMFVGGISSAFAMHLFGFM